ncbi:NADH-dependent flavin oxidoreductase [Carnobacterium sp. ISL-102]|uniref:NADH-dependent flavin oxidoreductase n=1 Tax=Carnobacterium sp. ISL-102 TaxID=2819142 RepID=UPI001BE67766|nr:NADH-dependent flavin oxidoreductase [Carnobacterium sp. ISL-102]MBT2732041.1 NADH-dependent flavin oxidoreductase [Carnobacterium sp. ISL-102]
MTKYDFLDSFEFKNGQQLKNKIVMAPMTTMSSFHNGMITTDEINYYAARAGGPGMIITGVAYVSDGGKGFEGELSVADDSMIPGLVKLATAIKQRGTKAVLQIFHVGRKTYARILKGDQPVSASAIAAPYPTDSEMPKELTNDEIEQIIVDFGEATRRAIVAGFDGVELHGANTYLLQQFYSEHSNRRTDKWGGSRDKRLTFPLAVIDHASDIIKRYSKNPFILGYRMSPEEIETPGIRLADSLYFADAIKEKVDYLHLSIASYKRTSLNDKADVTPILNQFAKITENFVPLIGVGSVENPKNADDVLANGADLVAVGRELIREPQWVQKVASNDEESIRREISPSDLDELAIPSVMQVYLVESFSSVMHFSTDSANVNDDYSGQFAPMEGYEKKL